MRYTLPKTLTIGDKELEIRYDFRNILNCIVILNADDLSEQERLIAFFCEFYVNPEEIDDAQEAITKAMEFISCGTEKNATKRAYMNWEKDFDIIVAPVNKVLGVEIRSLPELHWWTFVSAFREIGECYFSQVVSIRHKKAEGKKLEKWEQEFYRDNKEDIDLPSVSDNVSIEEMIEQSGWCS